MRQLITREYFLEHHQIREAIHDYLKKIDRPVPKTINDLVVHYTSERLIVKYVETIEFKKET